MTAPRRNPRLCEPRQAADHVRLVVDPRSHHRHTLLLVTADERDRPVHHVEVVECPPDPSTSECAAVLGDLVAAVASEPDGGELRGLLLAITRPGGEVVQHGDRVWFRAFHRLCHSRGLRPLGVFLVGRHGARAIHIDDAA